MSWGEAPSTYRLVTHTARKSADAADQDFAALDILADHLKSAANCAECGYRYVVEECEGHCYMLEHPPTSDCPWFKQQDFPAHIGDKT
jgi:hypothetical protein